MTVNYFIAFIGMMFLFMSFAWAFLPGGFGITNFGNSHIKPLFYIGMLFWIALLLIHLVFIYFLWSDLISHGQVFYRWIFLPVPFQILFFLIFARDVSTG